MHLGQVAGTEIAMSYTECIHLCKITVIYCKLPLLFYRELQKFFSS